MCTSSCTVEKIQIPFSMAIVDVELMHECFPKHSCMGTAREEGKKRGVSMERSKAGTKKRSPDGLSHSN